MSVRDLHRRLDTIGAIVAPETEEITVSFEMPGPAEMAHPEHDGAPDLDCDFCTAQREPAEGELEAIRRDWEALKARHRPITFSVPKPARSGTKRGGT